MPRGIWSLGLVVPAGGESAKARHADDYLDLGEPFSGKPKKSRHSSVARGADGAPILPTPGMEVDGA